MYGTDTDDDSTQFWEYVRTYVCTYLHPYIVDPVQVCDGLMSEAIDQVHGDMLTLLYSALVW
jgi:hypothetical protein